MLHHDDWLIWDTLSVRVLQVTHGLLSNESFHGRFESNALLFLFGKGARAVIGDTHYRIASSCLFLVAPDCPIVLNADGQELSYYFITYFPEPLPNTGKQQIVAFSKTTFFQQCHAFHISSPLLFVEQFAEIIAIWNEALPVRPLKAKACFYSLLCLLYRDIQKNRSVPLLAEPFEQAKSYLQNHYAQPLSIQQIAASLGITRAALCLQFKKRLGISPHQYLTKLRLDAARQALCETDFPIDEIAASHGLRDRAYFSRVFKHHFGLSPGAFRQEKCLSTPALKKHRTLRAALPVRESFTIENMGRIHRYYKSPDRVICLDYSAAEFCIALGVADRIVALSPAENSIWDCAEEYREILSRIPVLLNQSSDKNVPGFEQICARQPELVIGSSYSFSRFGGVADAESFERRDIHIYALHATTVLNSTFRDICRDIRLLGKIFDREEQAALLCQKLRDQERELSSVDAPSPSPIRVFAFDALLENKAFTCGQSLENYMIRRAGGINIFGDRPRQFLRVAWHEVAERNPQVILVHGFQNYENSLQKVELLKRIPEIADTDAIRQNRLYIIGLKKLFPSLDSIEAVIQLRRWLQSQAPF
ncbi:MAG: AraC family transcriptional regulator [Ndongobacter sp.]|nr:AraC family transcriptional regulator [Ndongobacter sp.]